MSQLLNALKIAIAYQQGRWGRNRDTNRKR